MWALTAKLTGWVNRYSPSWNGGEEAAAASRLSINLPQQEREVHGILTLGGLSAVMGILKKTY